MLSRYQKGIWAEFLTLVFLTFKGYRLLGRRVRTPVGEIDLLMRRRSLLVVVEVKYRRHIRLAGEAVSMTQKRRVVRALKYWCLQHPLYARHTIRFDVVLCVPWRCPYHIKSAWLPEFEI